MRHFREIPLWKDVTDQDWFDWKWQVRNRLRSLDELAQVINLTDEERAGLDFAEHDFPVGVNPYYAALMDPDDPNCPIRKQALPVGDESVLGQHDMVDPLHEDVDSPVPFLTWRYPDRVLFIVTEMCAMYCRHCTRRRLVGRQEGGIPRPAVDRVIDFLKEHHQIRDVLISGGDPLSLADSRLEYILARLREVPHIEVVRIGTRVLVTNPMRITPEFAAMVKKYHPIWVNTHFNHPREVTPETRRACELLADAGCPLGNQTVLLRGVNDCPYIQKRLVQDLVKMRVRPYYLYQCDLSQGIEHFRTPVSKGIEIIEHLRGHVSGYAVPTFVVDAPEGGGKIPVMPNYVVSQSPGRIVLRNYEGRIASYPEPEHGDTHDPAQCEYCRAAHAAGGSEGVAGLLSNPRDAEGRAIMPVRSHNRAADGTPHHEVPHHHWSGEASAERNGRSSAAAGDPEGAANGRGGDQARSIGGTAGIKPPA
ncbi:MAG TPA: lysine 2,3-aminomutase [Limnochordia bacterium]|nr:lysine 2,3-aminomutase [Limnochordia bacterium]